MTTWVGDFAPGAVVVFPFTTINTSGVPTVLSGSPQAAIYKGTTASAITAGVTLALSYVSALTGANLVKIDTSQDTTNYTPGNDYTLALASGLVGTTTISGYVLALFSLTNRGPANNVSGISQSNVVQIAGTVAVSSLALGNTNVVQIAQTGTVSSLALGNTNLVTWVGSGPNALQNGLVQVAIVSGGAAGSSNITQINGVAVQAASGFLQANLVQVLGVATQTSLAQLGVNVTQWRDITPNALQNGLVQASILSGAGTGGSGNITQINGVAVQAASGILQTNLVQITGIAPVLDSNNLLKVDVEDILGAAVLTSSAQLGVNVVNWAGSAVPFPAQPGRPKVDLTHIIGSAVATSSAQLGVNVVTIGGQATVSSLALGQTNVVQIAQTGTVSSLALGNTNLVTWLGTSPAPLTATLVQTSVSGNIAGNVVGSVGSVTARVTANTDQIAGATVNALISGRVDSTPGQIQANAIGTTGFVAGALTTTVFAAPYLTSALIDTTYSNAVADALLDRSNAIETGLTPRQALRLDASAQGGKLSGAGTTSVNIWGAGVSTNRISATTDQSGNRLAVTLNL